MFTNSKSTLILVILKKYFAILFIASTSSLMGQKSLDLNEKSLQNIILTRTISVCGETAKDADIAGGQPTVNFANYTHFGGYTWSCNGNLCISRGLMQIDLTVIPGNAIIHSALLFLYADITWGATPSLGPGNSGTLLKLNGAWQENTLTWNNQPSTLPTNAVSIPQSTSNVQDYILDITGMTQDWVNTPATNYGLMIKLDDEQNYYKSLMFASSDGLDATKCPKLVINYSLANPVGINSFSHDQVSVYPNPITNTFKVKGLDDACSFVITDLSGREIFSGITKENDEISLAENVPGIYFLHVQTKNTLLKYRIVKLNTN